MTQTDFERTVFSLSDEMYRFAKKFVLSTDEAQDVVQDLMMKFWQKKEQFEEFGNIKSYVLKSVKNECLNRLKHQEMKRNFADLHQHRSESYHVEANNLNEQIIGFINQLPEKQKAVMHLKDVEELEVAEIAEILEMEQNAIRVNLMRARQKVKNQIEKLIAYENKMVKNI